MNDFSTLNTVVSIISVVLTLVATWKIFEKVNIPGWKALIPIYNIFVLFKITWGSGWYMLLILIPIVNFVVGIITAIKLGSVFNKGIGFKIGLIFLSGIFMLILGFDDSEYMRPSK